MLDLSAGLLLVQVGLEARYPMVHWNKRTSGRCGKSGLLCASRWHATADEYAKFALDPAIARYHTDGLEATLTCYSSIDVQL